MKMNKKIGIYFPVVENSENEKNALCRLMSEYFGGCSVSKIEGYYLMGNGELCKDEIFYIYSNCTKKDYKHYKKSITNIAITLRNALKQEAIGIQYNETLKYI